jgi:hypothetical protein
MKWATFVSLSTITQIESYLAEVWGRPTVISQQNVDQKLIFGAWMWEKGCGPLDATSEVIWGVVSVLPQKNLVTAPLFPLSWYHPPCPTLGRPSPSPFAGGPLSSNDSRPPPLHHFLLPLDPPHAARIEKRRSKMDWRGRGDQGDVLSPSLLADFLRETLGKDEIHVPPCN